MNKEIRKLLTGNPGADIDAILPHLTQEQRHRATVLISRYGEIRAQTSQLRQEAGRISRQIGSARTGDGPPEDLKSAMQARSRQLADLNSELRQIEQQFGQLSEPSSATSGNTARADAGSSSRYRINGQPASPVTVTLLQDDTAEWDDYVSRHPAASLYHRAQWRDIIGNTFGHRSYYCLARDASGQPAGVLPLIRLSSWLFGDYMVSMPYFNYGGPLGDNAEIEAQLIGFASALGCEMGVRHIEFRDEIPRPGMPVRTGKVNMVRELPATEQELENSFSSKLRSQIRRAQREEPQSVIGGAELLGEFYAVFCRNMRDLGTPVYTRRFFHNILGTFPDSCRILVVRLGRRPVAAGFLVEWSGRMEIPWASTIRDVNHLSINMSLYREALGFAVRQGCTSFDFGRSSLDSGTYRFKQQWGARPHQLYWHYWLPEAGQLPALNPSNPRYAAFISLWKRLPLPVTRLLGPAIVKNLP